jgi:tRNA (cmo5U34)-methyltransferase
MSSPSVKNLFDSGAGQYDGSRRKVIFCFDDFYGTLLELVPFEPQQYFRFLDLGAGTGLVSSLIMGAFPHAEAELLDVSEKMMAKARQRFTGNDHVRFYIRDYEGQDLPGRWPLIVSAMSIHHLSDSGKQRLMGQLLEALESGGRFIHAELARGATPASEEAYQRHWRRHLEGTDIDRRELEAIYKRMACDQPARLEDQLAWMRAAGFVDVDCYYKHYNFCVYAGDKPDKL